DLEHSIGAVETALPIASAFALTYPGTLETFEVTNLDASGPGSLAAAVASANANANPAETDRIVFRGLNGPIAPGATLSITEPLAIVGSGQITIDGGGASRVFDVSAGLAISNLTIAQGRAAEGGGAFRVNGATLSIDLCSISGNVASENGGAIAAFASMVAVSRSTFSNNGGATGGAIFVSGSMLDIERSAFELNDALGNGGAIAIESSIAFIDDSLLARNDAVGDGGALHASQGEGGAPLLSVQNSTISGNTARVGGGLAAFGNAYAELVHATVTDNAMRQSGGTVCAASGVDGCGLSGQGLVLVESSILAGNRGGAGVDLAGDALDLELEVHTSLVGRVEGGVATSGEPIFGEDPLLGPLADNGGRSRTHALLEGSPAIDRGTNPGALAFDQRGAGFPRVRGARADMGAFEFNPGSTGTGGGGGNVDAGVDAGMIDVGLGGRGNDGCGCSVPGGAGNAPTSGGIVAGLLGLLAFGRRRRR
ncbi:MAG: hypothetical protein H5U40_07615, partial [Polyangiaceae bacterium]|nr:hypothetical protein [Polyangiaceae bacterium]